MARHGENIRKRKDGRWEGRYGVYDQEKEATVYVSVYGRSYGEVKEKLATKKNLRKKSQRIKAPATEKPGEKDMCLADVAGEWLEEVRKTKKRSTYVKYRQVYQNHIEKNFQGIQLREITDKSVNEKICQNGRLPESLSASLLKSIYCVLNQILKYASGKYPVTIASLRRPAAIARSKPATPFTQREQARLLEALYRKMDIFKFAALLCMHTGLRLGELCALKWSDLDFSGKILAVNRTVQRLYVEGLETKTVLLETDPKSESSRREIPISDDVVGLFLKFRNGKEYIFGGDKPLEPRTMQNHFKKILEEARLPDKKFHILRHTFATNCVEGGTDVKSLSEILGHSDVRITLNRYVHPSMDSKRRYMDCLCVFYGQIYGQAS